jgi:hypothetical protein
VHISIGGDNDHCNYLIIIINPPFQKGFRGRLQLSADLGPIQTKDTQILNFLRRRDERWTASDHDTSKYWLTDVKLSYSINCNLLL